MKNFIIIVGSVYVKQILKTNIESGTLKIIELSPIVSWYEISQPMIELSPLFIDHVRGQPIRIKNALINIDFIFFAFLDNSEMVLFKEEFPRVFTGPTQIFLVQREGTIFILEIRVVGRGHGTKAESP